MTPRNRSSYHVDNDVDGFKAAINACWVVEYTDQKSKLLRQAQNITVGCNTGPDTLPLGKKNVRCAAGY